MSVIAGFIYVSFMGEITFLFHHSFIKTVSIIKDKLIEKVKSLMTYVMH